MPGYALYHIILLNKYNYSRCVCIVNYQELHDRKTNSSVYPRRIPCHAGTEPTVRQMNSKRSLYKAATVATLEVVSTYMVASHDL